jgi:hypothetical protein
MIAVLPLARTAGAILALFMCVYIIGNLSRQEISYSESRLNDTVDSAWNVVNKCGHEVEPRMRVALITYLAVEDYFRPAFVRRLEFLLASVGAHIGIRPVGTIGIGQISLDTYLAARSDNRNRDAAEQRKNWIIDLQNDCENVSILLETVNNARLSCSSSAFVCSMLDICVWHTGKPDRCWEAKYRPYLEDVAITYRKVRAKKNKQQSVY